MGKRVRRISFAVVVAVAVGGLLSAAAAKAEDKQPGPPVVELPDGCKTQEGAKDDHGKWVLPDGTPTFHICKKNGTLVVDWYTYNGYRRYHSECHVCHGPNGLGSTYAPALANSFKRLSYADVLGTVASGRRRNEAGTEFVMPAFGDNKNVMCFIDDIYLYLKSRAEGVLPAGQLGGRNHDPKPDVARENDKACFGD
jgi:methanol metabolism-related c-type cytochrome